MASVYLRPSRKIYTAFFRDAQGKQHCKSTGSQNKKLAQKIADDYEQAAREKRTLRQYMKVMDAMHEKISGQKISRLSIAEHVTAWLAATKLEVSENTYSFYVGSTNKLLSFLGGDRALASIVKGDLVAYRAHLAGSLGSSTVNHHLVLVRMLFKDARRDGILADDPSEHLDSVKSTGGAKRRAFTVPELQSLMAVTADDPEWQSMIMFGLYTGQRLGDVARLTWASIDLTRNEIRLTTQKTGREITLPVAPPLLAHIQGLQTPSALADPIHPRAAATPNTSVLSVQFERILIKAGLRKPRPRKRAERDGDRRSIDELSFHSIRHSLTSMLHEAGLPPSVVRAFIGHSSAETNALYTHVGTDALAKAACALPQIQILATK